MITSLDLIVNGAKTENLPTIEQISQDYKHNSIIMAQGDDNPKLFAWKFLYTDYLIEASKFWEGQTIVDLGCGRQLDGYIIAKIAGASKYVGVDPYNLGRFYKRLTNQEERKGDKELNDKILKVREFIQTIRNYNQEIVAKIINNIDRHLNGKHLPVALIAEDMVSALRRLPNYSVSIMTAGLDNCIIWRNEYTELAEKEISRVLHSRGAYLSICSRLVPKQLKLDTSFESNTFRKFTKSD